MTFYYWFQDMRWNFQPCKHIRYIEHMVLSEKMRMFLQNKISKYSNRRLLTFDEYWDSL